LLGGAAESEGSADLRFVFERDGCETAICSEVDALETARRFLPDLIVVVHDAPSAETLALMRAFGTDPMICTVPVLLYGGDEQPEGIGTIALGVAESVSRTDGLQRLRQVATRLLRCSLSIDDPPNE